ncbi:MAG TPA: FAD-binding protein [Mycobacteriales bacterium]|nr:FAD-binding protein [Mycobacteriales bacterium]
MTGLRAATNWGGNLTYGARRVLRPRSIDELRGLVAGSDRIKALGTMHSFSQVADTTGDLVSLTDLPPRLEIDQDTVTVSAGLRFGDVVGPLNTAGRALHNLGSLPHISVAGACATGTHGSGDGNPCLAAAVTSFELVTAAGDLVTVDEPGAAVALGRLGVVTALTLRTVPAYDIQQVVYENLPLDAIDDLDGVFGAAYSVSLFTRFRGPEFEMAWLKRRVDPGAPWTPPETWLGATRAQGQRHPVPGEPGDHTTLQDGLPAPWHTRLPHFRLESTPSKGDEIQSEFLVPREYGAAAVRAVQALRERLAPLLLVAEIRTVRGDDLWASMARGRDSVALHFTWVRDQPAVEAAVAEVEAAIAPFDPRPHWGKVFTMTPERVPELRTLADRLDPGGVFANEFADRYL